jgi:hypothetical protein
MLMTAANFGTIYGENDTPIWEPLSGRQDRELARKNDNKLPNEFDLSLYKGVTYRYNARVLNRRRKSMPRLSSAIATGVAGKASRVLGLSALLWLSPAWAAEVTIRENSPTQYTVVEGDTLWDIAGMFLEEPWLWPEVWQINPQIEDPDLIYPGDVIELAYVDGNPVLRLSRGTAPEGVRTVRLSPQVRRETLTGPNPIAAIALDEISAYLSGNSIVSEAAFESAPYVLGGRERRGLLAAGDDVLARGTWSDGVAVYDIVRRGRDLEDPDSEEILGVEAVLVGTATLARSDDDQAVLAITTNEQEIRAGDRLLPRLNVALSESYLPTPPAFAVDAAIVSIGTGRQIGGTYDTLVINVGANDRIAVGQLLTVQDSPEVFDDQIGKRSAWQRLKHAFGAERSNEVTFSGENAAQILIYRVFDDASLGLVLDSNRDVRLNDRVVTPQ